MDMPIEVNEKLIAELYQILSALDAPKPVLDQVMAAMEGEPLPYESLLPFVSDIEEEAFTADLEIDP